jgi:CRP/FNR family transcriptional regulator, cyclic AMP receptor protein
MASTSLPTFSRAALLDLKPLPTVEFRRAEVIFSPDDACDSVMYIQCGGVQVSVVSHSGREAVVAVLGPGDFLGEGCLAGEPTRMRSAIAVTRSTLVVVAKDEMMRLLRQAPVSARLLSHVLARHATMEQALIDQLFSSTETRLARTLLLLARYGTHGRPQKVLRHVSRATLADMVGATPACISALISKFRRAGLIEYRGGIVVKRSLLRLMLHD